jgi:hypothetical protein
MNLSGNETMLTSKRSDLVYFYNASKKQWQVNVMTPDDSDTIESSHVAASINNETFSHACLDNKNRPICKTFGMLLKMKLADELVIVGN